jgi:hypothetical protein
MTSTGPTRDEFLEHVHPPLANLDGDPPKGTSTTSTTRYRWRTLHHWDVEADANVYWEGLPDADKTGRLGVHPAYWEAMESTMTSSSQPRGSEHALIVPFSNAYNTPHDQAIKGASDAHAEIWVEGSQLDPSLIGKADFLFVYDGKLTGVIELKTWWNVTEDDIQDVKAGKSIRCDANGRS